MPAILLNLLLSLAVSLSARLPEALQKPFDLSGVWPQEGSFSQKLGQAHRLFTGSFTGPLPSTWQEASWEGCQLVRRLPPVESAFFGLWYVPQESFTSMVKESGQRYLYINLMRRTGGEGRRSAALERLDLQEPLFSVITLDKDSAFYWQKEEAPVEIETFKKALLTHMQGQDYFFSDHFSLVLPSLIHKVHSRWFAQDRTLNSLQRAVFIELTYLEIIQEALAAWQPRSLSISCQECVDRGPSLSVLYQWMRHEQTDEQIAAALVVPARAFHHRAVHAKRVRRFMQVVDYLLMLRKNL